MLSTSRFSKAQVCKNGHVITAWADDPKRQKRFCELCGEKTMVSCSSCGATIHGKLCVEMEPIIENMKDAPRFCHHCGEPYPWTASRMEALKEAIDELKQLPAEEKQRLVSSVSDLVRDTPKTDIAAARFRKAIERSEIADAKMLSELLMKAGTEAALKTLGLTTE